MLTPTELSRIANVCASVGDDVTDADGFNPIRGLLARFDASLVFRPLLVEGMLARRNSGGEAAPAPGSWVILVDSERYQVEPQDVESERSASPLPVRLRNTIAHELVHSLAFRTSEFGIQIRALDKGSTGLTKLVKEIEARTEQFSPMLLWSRRSIGRFVKARSNPISASDLEEVRKTMGISGEVLIRRLALLAHTDAMRSSEALRNVGICLGTWTQQGAVVLKGWPLFLNFERNIVPAFFHNLVKQDQLPASAVFTDPMFATNGGPRLVTEFVCEAGTARTPGAEKMRVRCSTRLPDRNKTRSFVFVVEGLGNRWR